MSAANFTARSPLTFYQHLYYGAKFHSCGSQPERKHWTRDGDDAGAVSSPLLYSLSFCAGHPEEFATPLKLTELFIHHQSIAKLVPQR